MKLVNGLRALFGLEAKEAKIPLSAEGATQYLLDIHNEARKKHPSLDMDFDINTRGEIRAYMRPGGTYHDILTRKDLFCMRIDLLDKGNGYETASFKYGDYHDVSTSKNRAAFQRTVLKDIDGFMHKGQAVNAALMPKPSSPQ